jgi:hypothetical protein
VKHAHVSFLTGVITACFVIITLFAMRLAAGRLVESENPTMQTFGAGLAAVS